jgi:hypothetical protein
VAFRVSHFGQAVVTRTMSGGKTNICDEVRLCGHEYHPYRGQRPEAETDGDLQSLHC